MDKDKFRRKYLLGLATDKLTLFPILGGATFCGLFPILGPFGVLLGGAGILFGAGVFVQRLVTGCESIARQAQEETEKETRSAREASLDELDGRLVKDRDPRTQKLLRSVRDLSQLVQTDQDWREGLDIKTVLEFTRTVDRFFQGAVKGLERSLKLKAKANTAASKEIRDLYFAQRDSLIEEIKGNVEEFHRVVVDLHKSEARGARLGHLNEQLRRTLEVGKSVQQRLDSLGLGNHEEG